MPLRWHRESFLPKLLDVKSSLAHNASASPIPISSLSALSGPLWMSHSIVSPLLPSFTSFISYNGAHGDSEAPYPIQRYSWEEKIKADFVYKDRRWPSPFPPWKKLYRQPAGFIIRHLWTTVEGKISLKGKCEGAGGGRGGSPHSELSKPWMTRNSAGGCRGEDDDSEPVAVSTGSD